MAVTAESSAPYAPKSQVLEIIQRYRERGNPRPLNADALSRIGVPDSLNARVLQALRTLDLIDDNGEPTQTFEGIRLASTENYRNVLQSWLKAAYADIFSIVDPATDDEGKIRDAFRTYTPAGQQGRMVSLFIGLCEAAGIRAASKEPAPRAAKTRQNPPVAPRSTKQPQPRKLDTDLANYSQATGMLPPAVTGLLASLPSVNTGWTQVQRDKFVKTFEAVLDFSYPIIENRGGSGDDLED